MRLRWTAPRPEPNCRAETDEPAAVLAAPGLATRTVVVEQPQQAPPAGEDQSTGIRG